MTLSIEKCYKNEQEELFATRLVRAIPILPALSTRIPIKNLRLESRWEKALQLFLREIPLYLLP